MSERFSPIAAILAESAPKTRGLTRRVADLPPLAKLAAKEREQSKFSRARLPAQERRVRLLDEHPGVDAAGQAFYTFAIDARHGIRPIGDDGGWRKAAVPAWNPATEQDDWFTNMTFDLRGVHFVCVDWAPRAGGGIGGEMGEIHDFEGGTWPWFERVIEGLPKDVSESIVMASHIPMHMFAFTGGGIPAITRLLSPYGENVYANFDVPDDTVLE